MDTDVFFVRPAEAKEAANALAQAFVLESATNYFFPPEEGGKLEKLRALFGWAVEYRMRIGVPVLGVRGHPAEAGIVGAATLRIPEMPSSREADALWHGVQEVIGAAAEERMERYDEAQSVHKPKAPHHYLVAIGVRPEFHGQGFGSKLIRAAIALAEADGGSQGIALDTGSDENQALYERFGFQLTAVEKLDSKEVRFMFRPNRGVS